MHLCSHLRPFLHTVSVDCTGAGALVPLGDREAPAEKDTSSEFGNKFTTELSTRKPIVRKVEMQ